MNELKNMNDIINLTKDILSIKSPTFYEKEMVQFTRNYFEGLPGITFLEHNDSLIVKGPFKEGLPHIALVGHSDVVPDYFNVRVDGDKLHGSGASDMKGADACFMYLFKDLLQDHSIHNHSTSTNVLKYNVSFILYAREEGTPLVQNGLNDLINKEMDYFNSIDLAIVGEPTNMSIQLGCVGSCHAKVTVHGKESHSARPWDGENALYKALPIIQYFADLKPIKKEIFGVAFSDVMSITESSSDSGRTTIPGKWQANINYRYAPGITMKEAEEKLFSIFNSIGIKNHTVEIIDNVPAGQVIESELFTTVVKKLGFSIEAKQAWTDVAQLTQQGIPAFNFGPGLTAQAHKQDEYILMSDIQAYFESLKSLFLGK